MDPYTGLDKALVVLTVLAGIGALALGYAAIRIGKALLS